MQMIIINYGRLMDSLAFKNSDSIITMPIAIKVIGKLIMFCFIECLKEKRKQYMAKYSRQLSSMAVI